MVVALATRGIILSWRQLLACMVGTVNHVLDMRFLRWRELQISTCLRF